MTFNFKFHPAVPLIRIAGMLAPTHELVWDSCRRCITVRAR